MSQATPDVPARARLCINRRAGRRSSGSAHAVAGQPLQRGFTAASAARRTGPGRAFRRRRAAAGLVLLPATLACHATSIPPTAAEKPLPRRRAGGWRRPAGCPGAASSSSGASASERRSPAVPRRGRAGRGELAERERGEQRARVDEQVGDPRLAELRDEFFGRDGWASPRLARPAATCSAKVGGAVRPAADGSQALSRGPQADGPSRLLLATSTHRARASASEALALLRRIRQQRFLVTV